MSTTTPPADAEAGGQAATAKAKAALKQAVGGTTALQTRADRDISGQSPMSIRDVLNDPAQQAQIAKALPGAMSVERFTRICLTAVRTNPTLQQCSLASLLAACMQAAQLGLEPGVLGHSYLVPFWNNKTGSHDVQLIIGYKGYIDLAYRNEKVESIVAREVRENDHFEWSYGIDDILVHRPALEERGAPVRYYAIVKLKGGGHVLNVMNLEEISARRERSKSKDSGPWVTDFNQMAVKTVLRASVPFIPMSVQLAAAYVVDESVPTEIQKDMAAEFASQPVLDVPSVEGDGPSEDEDESDREVMSDSNGDD